MTLETRYLERCLELPSEPHPCDPPEPPWQRWIRHAHRWIIRSWRWLFPFA